MRNGNRVSCAVIADIQTSVKERNPIRADARVVRGMSQQQLILFFTIAGCLCQRLLRLHSWFVLLLNYLLLGYQGNCLQGK
jgi:hypothetical protein